MDEFLKLLSQLPSDRYIKFCVEEGRLVLYCYRKAPEDGWLTEGDYFNSPPDSERHNVPCRESWKYQDVVSWALCNDMKDFSKLIMETLRDEREQKENSQEAR